MKQATCSLPLPPAPKTIVMIEAGANEVDEATMLKAIKTGDAEIQKIITFINGIVAEIGKPKSSSSPWSWTTTCWRK